MELNEYHPSLRDVSKPVLAFRSSSFNFFLPAAMQVNWYGDIQLYCTAELYQSVLDSVPGAVTVGKGQYRRIDPQWTGLDRYRAKVRKWANSTGE